tara:strand:- start:83 stop:532 length:450 start_codon:yes stop_codon:yes gene_type:complete
MSIISIDLIWKTDNGHLIPGKYSNKHDIIFTPNTKIKGDSAPDWKGNKLNINPEQTLAASLSSCHMMTFLALAAKMNWPVISYQDKAIATLGKNSENKMAVIKIELNPKIKFLKDFTIDSSELKKVQDRAHRYCFIANSLSKEIKIFIN